MSKKLMVLALLLAAAIALVGCTQKAPDPTATPVVTPTASPTATIAPVIEATPAATEVVPAPVADAGTALTANLVLTEAELAKFNGKNGQPAYVAVDGIVYDVTNSSAWKNGDHNGYEAGKDLTKEIKTVSPHGISKLDNVIEIGKLAAQ